MKYATKFMVVPFVSKIPNPTENYLLELDNEMSKIVTDKELSVDEKIKMYNQTLKRFMINYTQNENKPKQEIIQPLKGEPIEPQISQAKKKVKKEPKPEEMREMVKQKNQQTKKDKKIKIIDSARGISPTDALDTQDDDDEEVDSFPDRSSNLFDRLPHLDTSDLYTTINEPSTSPSPPKTPTTIRKRPVIRNIQLNPNYRTDNINTIPAQFDDLLNKKMQTGKGFWKTRKFFN